MKLINDKFFIDSNVILYLMDKSPSHKKQVAMSLIDKIGFVSPQVIFECLNVCVKKQKLDKEKALQFVKYIIASSFLQEDSLQVVETSLSIYKQYNLQIYDSKIIGSALVAGCETIYSEDMQHGLQIEKRLTIINPFLQA